jgi:hypothetical protein
MIERQWVKQAAGFMRVYRSVPLFLYVRHLYLIHLMLIPYSARHGESPARALAQANDAHIPARWGFSLPIVYAVWIAIVAALYRPCRWFNRLKALRREW